MTTCQSSLKCLLVSLQPACDAQAGGAQTSSESEHLISRSHTSLATLLSRHPDWEIPPTELSFEQGPDG